MTPSLLQSVRGKRNGDLHAIEASVEEQIEHLRTDLAALTSLIREKSAEQGKKVRQQAETGFNEILSTSEELLKEARDAYLRGGQELRHTVRRHPVATIGAAAAFGIILALLARR